MSWYVITCRLSGDDEDSCYVLQANNWQEASRRAEWTIRTEQDDKAEYEVIATLPDGTTEDYTGFFESQEVAEEDGRERYPEATKLDVEYCDEQQTPFYLNYAVRCPGDEKPEIELCNAF